MPAVHQRGLVQGHRTRSGQALIEFALVIPLLFLLIINVVNFGGLLYAWVTVANAARAGADYWLMGSSYAHAPGQATAAQVAALVTNDLISLPNRGSAVISVCYNNAGSITCVPSGGTLPVDPESGLYLSGSVDVTYTYQPLISFWSFPNLRIRLTLPPTTVHRKTVIRMV